MEDPQNRASTEDELNDTLDQLIAECEARFGKADDEDCERMAEELLLQMCLARTFRYDYETRAISRR